MEPIGNLEFATDIGGARIRTPPIAAHHLDRRKLRHHCLRGVLTSPFPHQQKSMRFSIREYAEVPGMGPA